MVAYAELFEPEVSNDPSPFEAAVAVAVEDDGEVADGLLLASRVCAEKQGEATFTGYITDNETGLLHARARQYSPTLGRFVNRDPFCKYGWDTLSARKSDAIARSDQLRNELSAIRVAAYDPQKTYTSVVLLKAELNQWQALTMSERFGPMPADGYHDGYSLYGAYFVPNAVDPTGMVSFEACVQYGFETVFGPAEAGMLIACIRKCKMNPACYVCCGVAVPAGLLLGCALQTIWN